MAQVHRCIHSVMNDSENPMLSLSFRVTAIYAVLPLRSRIGYRRGLMSRKIVTFNKYHRIDTDFRNAVVFDVSNSMRSIVFAKDLIRIFWTRYFWNMADKNVNSGNRINRFKWIFSCLAWIFFFQRIYFYRLLSLFPFSKIIFEW